MYNSVSSLRNFQVGFGFIPEKVVVIYASAKSVSVCAWYYLDQNKDGKVCCSDLTESISKAYSFMTSLSCEDVKGLKLELFRNAVAYMKEELENDRQALMASKVKKHD